MVGQGQHECAHHSPFKNILSVFCRELQKKCVSLRMQQIERIMEQLMRKYPVGIQTFERIIKEGFVYVDKTDLVWELAHYATFVFMSRPRRFGKSLLTSTLESYF